MSQDQRIIDLLMQYLDAIDAGAPKTPAELCADCPELLPGLTEAVEHHDRANRVVDPTPELEPAEPPTDFDAGRYRPLEFIAGGGQGEVYSAIDGEVGRPVALKLLREDAAHQPFVRERFLLEAEITSRLEHPGVVPIYGLGNTADGRLFYAMRLFDRLTLQTEIDKFHDRQSRLSGVFEGPLRMIHKLPDSFTPERAAEFRRLLRAFIAVCETVAYAHARGVIHRDLKPKNVILGDYGETLVLDWGLAKRVGAPEPAPSADPNESQGDTGADSGSLTGFAMGTWEYMPPEQARGEWDKVGPASDVFGLGAILFAILSGCPPYTGSNREECARQCRFEKPTRIRCGAAVPRALEAVCLKAMAARPEDRYASAQEVARDIQRYLDDEPVSAWREPLRVRTRRWLKRHRTLMTAGVVGLVVAAAGASALAALEAKRNEQLETANGELDRERALEAEAREQAERFQKEAEASAKRVLGQIAQLQDLLMSPEMNAYSNDPVYRLTLSGLSSQLGTLATELPDGQLRDQTQVMWHVLAVYLLHLEQPSGFPPDLRQGLAKTRAALEEYARKYPGDPWADLSLASSHAMEGIRLVSMGPKEREMADYHFYLARDIFARHADGPERARAVTSRALLLALQLQTRRPSRPGELTGADVGSLPRFDSDKLNAELRALDRLENTKLGPELSPSDKLRLQTARLALLALKAQNSARDGSGPARQAAESMLKVIDAVRAEYRTQPVILSQQALAKFLLATLAWQDRDRRRAWSLLSEGCEAVEAATKASPGGGVPWLESQAADMHLKRAQMGNELLSAANRQNPQQRQELTEIAVGVYNSLELAAQHTSRVQTLRDDEKFVNTLKHELREWDQYRKDLGLAPPRK